MNQSKITLSSIQQLREWATKNQLFPATGKELKKLGHTVDFSGNELKDEERYYTLRQRGMTLWEKDK